MTTVELVVAMSLATIVFVGLFGLIFSFFTTNSKSLVSLEQTQTTESAMNTIRTDLPLTRGFLATTTIDDVPPADPAVLPVPTTWRFNGLSGLNNTLILETVSITQHPSQEDRDITYLAAGECPIGMQPAKNNIIYYVQNQTLYRRVLVADVPQSTYCPGQSPFESRTCTDPSATNKPANCTRKDVAIAHNISAFTVDYFEDSASAEPHPTIYTDENPQAILDNTTTINVTLSVEKGDQYETYTAATRLSR